jgi:hypothetical protein
MSTQGFIRYENKNGKEYASLYKARRDGGKKVNDVEYLGRVINKADGIYKSRERGTFTFSPEKGFGIINLQGESTKERRILDFGDSYFLHSVLEKTGLLKVLENVEPGEKDTLMALMFHRVLSSNSAGSRAMTWWEGSYARQLYPRAELKSQRVSDALRGLGDEELQRRFFKEYIAYVSVGQRSHGVLIDSTGLPNDAHFDLTAVNSHNGVVSNETRLILVLDKVTGMPLYFRYAAGNIVDVTTLKTTFSELKAMGVEVDCAIVDAGYYSEGNVREMLEAGIHFLVRLVSNRKLYKELVNEYAETLESARNLVKYRERVLYIKKAAVDLFGSNGFAYVAIDIDRKHDELKRYVSSALDDGDVSIEDMDAAMLTKGMFILISSQDIDVKEILPLYYTRQSIEQVFDVGKNEVELLPIRVHGEEAFRGHLLVSFMASAAFLTTNKLLKGFDMGASLAFQHFRNLKCKVYDGKVVVQETNRIMNDILKYTKISFPQEINMW